MRPGLSSPEGEVYLGVLAFHLAGLELGQLGLDLRLQLLVRVLLRRQVILVYLQNFHRLEQRSLSNNHVEVVCSLWLGNADLAFSPVSHASPKLLAFEPSLLFD